MDHNLQQEMAVLEAAAVILLFLAFLLYPLAAALTSLRYKAWPLYRIFLWCLGVFTIAITFTGPLADFAQANFVGHMWTHLLLGMLAPLLLLFAMPMTLLLRSLPVPMARNVSVVLKSRLFKLLSNPIAAFTLNIGGMYVLYLTNLFAWMHQSLIVYALVHLHVFLAGYLFTASIIYIDVTSHRLSYLFRSIVLVLSLAAHQILSKMIYADPPADVSRTEAEMGGMVMYYGGDFVELVIIVILCYQWYKATAPRKTEPAEKV
ncbi:cytochrome c oxidase assembly protein [Planococcus sp. ISL-110]|uniref:cytochrome c oxidase assembly protein n=1 Tax=Planococcus sp. ISL-110 TaxID=2819167 RepID=UPI001BEC072B|nr:cytochrome c oxidase assembly protein [Planococcus sp. ISL-110]MBT2570833.1 cytochrome c oxidase assembly protein [Planococcus sp. ISL-110]